MIQSIDNFFPNFDLILKEAKRVPLYDLKRHKKLVTKYDQGNWPGLRSDDLTETNPALITLFLNILKQHNMVSRNIKSLTSCIHLRGVKDEANDWMHKDDSLVSGLLYLNETNLNSGTKLYDDNKNETANFKYVQNRYIQFPGHINHAAYGHFGNNVDDGRLTLNIFFYET
jgi:hypothetical protein